MLCVSDAPSRRNFFRFPWQSSPVVKTALPLQGVWVQPLAGELGSHMPHSAPTTPTAPRKRRNKRTPSKDCEVN